MNFVLDTNVIISAFLKKDSYPYMVYSYAFSNDNVVYMTEDIYNEYDRVLNNDKLKFKKSTILGVLSFIVKRTVFVSVVHYHYNNKFSDESDRKFYELAKSHKCFLITGNKKHYPNDPIVLSPKEFIDKLEKSA